jgi:hypothetical protein
MPWLITMAEQPAKRPFWRDKLQTSTRVSQLGLTYKIIGTLKCCCRDYQLVVAYQSQLKGRTQMSSESLQEFSSAVKKSAHQALC